MLEKVVETEDRGRVIIAEVPAGYRYVSDIPDFKLHDFPHILNKQIPGCGFTEYCIRNEENVILCSPRKILLQNKYEQHKDEVFLVVNEFEGDPKTDKDLTKIERPRYSNYEDKEKIKKKKEELEKAKENFFQELTKKLTGYVNKCLFDEKPVKILVTYDSYRLVKEILKFNYSNVDFRVVVDEFQSIFTDSKFKSDTEMQFMDHLQGVKKVCYVSATPMIKKYLDMLEEFKDLPYYELDWCTLDHNRIDQPKLTVKNLVSVYAEAGPIIKSYLGCKFEYRYVRDPDSENEKDVKKIVSKEAVFYVNSVNNITSIIKRAGLTPGQVNILVANTQDNEKKIKKRLGRKFNIGRVPLRDEPRKMFTFCTRTVYLGADFYSDNARSFIISDANIDTLAVDITLDLPQILGRQRLKENPWKNEATLFFRPVLDSNVVSEEYFNKKIAKKTEKTEKLLGVFGKSDLSEQEALSEVFQDNAKYGHYKKNYVSVNQVKNPDGSIKLVPVLNKLVRVAELRSFEMQQVDYANRFTVFNELGKVSNIGTAENYTEFFKEYEAMKDRRQRLKYVCEYYFNGGELEPLLDLLPDKRFKEYLTTLGPENCRAKGYNLGRINDFLNVNSFDDKVLVGELYSTFEVGMTYSNSLAKSMMSDAYKRIDYRASAKASDLSKYFELRRTSVQESDGSRSNGFKILGKKFNFEEDKEGDKE